MEFTNLKYGRESDGEIVPPWQNKYRSEVFTPFDSTISIIGTELHIGNQVENKLESKSGLQMMTRSSFKGSEQSNDTRRERNDEAKMPDFSLGRDDDSALFSKWLSISKMQREFLVE